MAHERTKLTLNELLQKAEIKWHGVRLDSPDWSEQSRSLAFTLRSLYGRFSLHGMLNAYWEPLSFELPPDDLENRKPWRRCVDTALRSPDDICPWEKAPAVSQTTYTVEARSLVLLARAIQ